MASTNTLPKASSLEQCKKASAERYSNGIRSGGAVSSVNLPGSCAEAAFAIWLRSGPSPATTKCASGIRLTASIPVSTRLLAINALTISTM